MDVADETSASIASVLRVRPRVTAYILTKELRSGSGSPPCHDANVYSHHHGRAEDSSARTSGVSTCPARSTRTVIW